VLRRFGLVERFEVVHSGEDEELSKPDPAIFLSTARMLAVTPGACVVFEDSAAGVLAAKGAGMICVAVPEADPTTASRLPSAGGAGEALVDVVRRADVVLGSLLELDDAVWDALAMGR
jgi:sugar-phosphatase